MQDFEKLGVFYLGRRSTRRRSRRRRRAAALRLAGPGHPRRVRRHDRQRQDRPLHRRCSRRPRSTACPRSIIDPKGDLAQPAADLPRPAPGGLPPWINAEDAARKGLTRGGATPPQQAELWRKGLADWGQDGERIRRLRDAAEFAIYTPGSDAGLPLSILSSFAAPPAAVVDDAELFRDRIETTATSLLALLGIDADPLQSREHILLATLLDARLARGRGASTWPG